MFAGTIENAQGRHVSPAFAEYRDAEAWIAEAFGYDPDTYHAEDVFGDADAAGIIAEVVACES